MTESPTTPPFGGSGVDLGERTHLRFAQITDIHVSTQRRCLPEDLREDLARILDNDELDFLIASGDLTAGGAPEEFAAFREIVDALPIPVYTAAGNHDDDSGVEANSYQQALGPLYYSADVGPLHLVIYDGEAWQRQGLDTGGNVEAFPWIASSVDDWLDADLAAQPPDRPILLVNHFPWGEQLYRRLHGHRVVAVLSGHWHSSRRCVDSGGFVHYATPSLCFGGIDQSPRGYRTFTFAQGRLRSRSHCLDPQQQWPGIGEGYRPATARTVPSFHRDWPQFHGNSRRTGFVAAGPTAPLALAWCSPAQGNIHSAAPVLHRGTLIQTTWDDDDGSGAGVAAMDALSGEPLWRYSTSASIRHAAACADGRVHAITITGQLVSLDIADGTLLWSYDLPDPSNRWVYSSPVIDNGQIITGVSSHLICLNAQDGAVEWVRCGLGCEDWISSYPSPAIDGDYLVVAFYIQPTSLAVLDRRTGATIWVRDGDKSHHVYTTPVIGDGVVYAVSGSCVRAMELESGHVLWECPIALQRIQATPALAPDRLIVATGQGQIHAIDLQTGAIIWSWQLDTRRPLFTPYLRQGATTPSSPIVAGDQVWVGAADGCLYCLSLDAGEEIWRSDLGAPLAAPAVVSGQCLWIGATDGAVRCLVEEITHTRSSHREHN